MSTSEKHDTRGQKNKVLLTAFARTSAELLVKTAERWENCTVLMLPNDKVKDSELLTELLEREQFDYVISFGQRPNIKDKVHIETTAKKGGRSINTAFDCENLKLIFEQKGLVTKISNNAGNSFCNELYWNGLQNIAENGRNTKMVFVHVPYENNIANVEGFREKMIQSLSIVLK